MTVKVKLIFNQINSRFIFLTVIRLSASTSIIRLNKFCMSEGTKCGM